MFRSIASSFTTAPVSASGNGKVSVPVSQGSYIYSQFRHVSGVVAPKGVSGASISKLKILDTIIDRLSKIRKSGKNEIAVKMGNEESDARIDALIRAYQSQIKQLSAASEAMPYMPNPAISSGTFVNIAI